MADDVFVYLRDDIPASVGELVSPCPDGYTVLISSKLDDAHRQEAYEHALKHIENGDFDIDNVKTVEEIEAKAHSIKEEPAFVAKIPHKKKRRQSPRINFLIKNGYNFFSAAEQAWLEPKE